LSNFINAGKKISEKKEKIALNKKSLTELEFIRNEIDIILKNAKKSKILL